VQVVQVVQVMQVRKKAAEALKPIEAVEANLCKSNKDLQDYRLARPQDYFKKYLNPKLIPIDCAVTLALPAIILFRLSGIELSLKDEDGS
jgi:hypothetical protein